MSLLTIETLELGPAKYDFDGDVFASKSGGTLNTSFADFNVVGELSGAMHRRQLDVKAEVAFTPDDQVTQDLLDVLYGMLTKGMGESIFDSTAAKKLTIYTMDKNKFELQDAAISKPPDINFAVNKGLFGGVTFRARPAFGKVPGAADSLLIRTGGGATAWVPPTFLDTQFKVGTPSLTWNTAAIAGESDDGWTVSWNISTADVMGAHRLRDVRITSLECMVKGTPTDIDSSKFYTAMEMNTSVINSGQANRAKAYPLVLTMGGLTFTIPKAAPVSAGYRFGTQTLRNGEIGFVSVQVIGSPITFVTT